MVYECDCMGYLVSNAGCDGMSLFIVVRDELTGTSEISKKLSLSVSKKPSALIYPICYKGNAM